MSKPKCVVFKPISSGTPPDPLPVEDVIRFIGYTKPLHFYTPKGELIARFVALTEHDGKFKMICDGVSIGLFTIDSEIMMGNDFGAMPNKNSSAILEDPNFENGVMVVFNDTKYTNFVHAAKEFLTSSENHGGRKYKKMRTFRKTNSKIKRRKSAIKRRRRTSHK